MKLPEEIISEKFPETSSLVIRLASVEQMPHSVHLFLEQIYHKLWIGCAFVINAHHILQIGPHSFTEVGVDKLKPFQDLKLDKLAYQEYDETFPHEKYTLGFAGRPAGPDFYVNKVDNTINHGPGGQEHHALDEEADPCFAEIVEGFDLIDLISTIKVRGAQSILRHGVVVVGTELLENYTPPEDKRLRMRPKGSAETAV